MDVFSNLMIVGECLLDEKRSKAFKRAISQVVKPGDVVLDAGTGSGILAMFAARAGAKKVIAVEIAPELARFARRNILHNGLESKVQVIRADATKHIYANKFDVVIMELLDTGLVAEHQTYVINNLHRQKCVKSSTRFVPERLDAAIQFVEYDFKFFGNELPFIIQARNSGVASRIIHRLTERKVYKKFNFNSVLPLDIKEKLMVKVSKTGTINAMLLMSKTYLTKSVTLWGTSDMNMPVIIPITPIEVKNNDDLIVNIQYKPSKGYSQFKVTATKS